MRKNSGVEAHGPRVEFQDLHSIEDGDQPRAFPIWIGGQFHADEEFGNGKSGDAVRPVVIKLP